MGIQPRRTDAKGGPDRPDSRILLGLGNEFLGNGRKFMKVSTAGVLDLNGKASRGAEPSDWRCIKGQNQRFGNLCKFPEGSSDEGLRLLTRLFPFFPVFQRNEHRCGIRPSRVEHEVQA